MHVHVVKLVRTARAWDPTAAHLVRGSGFRRMVNAPPVNWHATDGSNLVEVITGRQWSGKRL